MGFLDSLTGGVASGLGSGIAQAGLGLFTSGINNYYQRKLMDYQNSWNEAMWKMNNEYNSPKNQVARLKEAGLNPNLAYGSLSGNVASPPSSTAVHAPLMDSVPIGDFILRAKQVENEGILARSEAARNDAEAADIQYRTSRDKDNRELLDDILRNQNKQTLKEIEDIDSTINEREIESKRDWIRVQLGQTQNDLREKEIAVEHEKIMNDFKIALRRVAIEYNVSKSQIDVLKKQADKLEAEGTHAWLIAGIAAKEYLKAGIDLDYYELEKIFDLIQSGTLSLHNVGSIITDFYSRGIIGKANNEVRQGRLKLEQRKQDYYENTYEHDVSYKNDYGRMVHKRGRMPRSVP